MGQSYTLDLVTQLANKGHEMGDQENALQEQCLGTESLLSGCSLSGTATEDSTVNAFIASTGESTTASDSTLTQQITLIQQTTKEFSELKAQLDSFLVKNPDALANYPEAQSIINFESQQIIALAQGIQDGSDSTSVLGFINTGDDIIANTAKLTHQSSDNICKNGGDTSNCVSKTG